MPPKHQTQRINDLLASVTEEMLGGDGQPFEDNSLRVERLLMEMVRPDPVQPRRVLPEAIHFAFHNHQLTPTQALRQLLQLKRSSVPVVVLAGQRRVERDIDLPE